MKPEKDPAHNNPSAAAPHRLLLASDSKPGISFAVIALLWTLVVAALGLTHYYQTSQAILKNAQTAARASLDRDKTFRKWLTEHGGIYVPVSETARPNPYMDHLPERDIVSASGQVLTLIDHSTMIHQVHDVADHHLESHSYVFGNRALSSSTAPSDREQEIIAAFQQGGEEWTELTNDTPRHLHLIQPFVADSSCLKCHGVQGFREGDILGGVGIMIPWADYQKELNDLTLNYAFGYGGLWLIGLLFTDFNRRRLRVHLKQRRQAEESLRLSEARYHSLFANSKAIMLLSDPQDGRIVHANPAACTYYGYTLERLQQMHLSDLNQLSHAEMTAELDRASAEDRHRLEFRHRLADGQVRDVASYCSLIDFSGRQLLYSIVHDITERKRAQRELRKLSLAAEQSPAVVVITDLNGNIEYVNPKFTAATGYTREEVLGKNPRILQSGKTMPAVYNDLWTTLLAGQEWHGELLNQRKDGTLFWEQSSISPLRDEDGKISHYICVKEDITSHKNHERQLEYQATHDHLTGLGNRILLKDRLAQAIRHAKRSKKIVAVLLLDLDRFKMVNDSLGHATGDQLLCQVTQRLTGAVRESDTVARFGGDEFVVLLTDLNNSEDVRPIAEKIRAAIAVPYFIAGREITLTSSIGISFYPADSDDSATLIRFADIAMYQAKKQGDQFSFYSADMNNNLLEALELESDLRQALEKGEFELHYQPKVDLGTGRINGCEALLRWRHPQRGMVSPGDFIPLAEETGVIVPIGTWVLEEACRQLIAWGNAGLPPVPIAVNLSARQFRQGHLATKVKDILHQSGADPALLELELTESMIMDDPQETVTSLYELRKIGVSLSLDDFGTGYSSLNYLRRFPVDSLKIDRSFIRDVATDPSGASVVTSIIDIAHNLNLTAIAEGVETREQLKFLINCGCDSMQGYLFSKPLPADELAQLLYEERSLLTLTDS